MLPIQCQVEEMGPSFIETNQMLKGIFKKVVYPNIENYIYITKLIAKLYNNS